jgi:hypothetical protein
LRRGRIKSRAKSRACTYTACPAYAPSLGSSPAIAGVSSRDFPWNGSQAQPRGLPRRPFGKGGGCPGKHSRAETPRDPFLFFGPGGPRRSHKRHRHDQMTLTCFLRSFRLCVRPSQGRHPRLPRGAHCTPNCFGHRLRPETPRSRPGTPLTHACRFVWLLPQTAGEAFQKICLRTLLR